MKRVLVYGWYGKGNLGDEAFKPAMQGLWPDAHFTFVDTLPTPQRMHQNFDALFFGGGSFTDQPIQGADRASEGFVPIIPIPHAYISVGIGDYIHSDHKWLLREAAIVIVRDQASYERYLDHFRTNRNLHLATDIAISLSIKTLMPARTVDKEWIGVCLSDSLTPRQASPIWQYDAHRWFVRELAKGLDDLSKHKPLYFMHFCVNKRETDERPMFEVTGKMDRYNYAFSRLGESNFEILKKIAASYFVITQRFHGAIFSMMLGVPCILIDSHDKMRSLIEDANILSVPYYGFTDKALNKAIMALKEWSPEQTIQYVEKGKQQWADLSATVAKLFGLSATNP